MHSQIVSQTGSRSCLYTWHATCGIFADMHIVCGLQSIIHVVDAVLVPSVSALELEVYHQELGDDYDNSEPVIAVLE